MAIIKELKTFMLRGNVVDMAVGVVVGGSFGKIVSSLVGDIIMPSIGVLIGGIDFTNLKIVLKSATGATPAVTLNYGSFIQTVLDFIIIGTAIFFVIKAINTLTEKLKDKEEGTSPVVEPEPEPSKEEILLTEIRDLLKKNTDQPK